MQLIVPISQLLNLFLAWIRDSITFCMELVDGSSMVFVLYLKFGNLVLQLGNIAVVVVFHFQVLPIEVD